MRSARGITCIIILSFYSKGSAIKCFQCNTAENPICSNVTSNSTDSPFYKDCSGNYDGHLPFCRKMETHVLYVQEIRVVRACGWIRKFNQSNKDECKKGDTDFIKKMTCSCFSDGCNSSYKTRESQFLTLLCLITSSLLCYV